MRLICKSARHFANTDVPKRCRACRSMYLSVPFSFFPRKKCHNSDPSEQTPSCLEPAAMARPKDPRAALRLNTSSSVPVAFLLVVFRQMLWRCAKNLNKPMLVTSLQLPAIILRPEENTCKVRQRGKYVQITQIEMLLQAHGKMEVRLGTSWKSRKCLIWRLRLSTNTMSRAIQTSFQGISDRQPDQGVSFDHFGSTDRYTQQHLIFVQNLKVLDLHEHRMPFKQSQRYIPLFSAAQGSNAILHICLCKYQAVRSPGLAAQTQRHISETFVKLLRFLHYVFNALCTNLITTRNRACQICGVSLHNHSQIRFYGVSSFWGSAARTYTLNLVKKLRKISDMKFHLWTDKTLKNIKASIYFLAVDTKISKWIQLHNLEFGCAPEMTK